TQPCWPRCYRSARWTVDAGALRGPSFRSEGFVDLAAVDYLLEAGDLAVGDRVTVHEAGPEWFAGLLVHARVPAPGHDLLPLAYHQVGCGLVAVPFSAQPHEHIRHNGLGAHVRSGVREASGLSPLDVVGEGGCNSTDIPCGEPHIHAIDHVNVAHVRAPSLRLADEGKCPPRDNPGSNTSKSGRPSRYSAQRCISPLSFRVQPLSQTDGLTGRRLCTPAFALRGLVVVLVLVLVGPRRGAGPVTGLAL